MSPSRSPRQRSPTSYYSSPVWSSRPSPSCAMPPYVSPVRSPVRVTVTSPSSIESDTVIPGPNNRGNTVPSSPRSPGREFAPTSTSGSPRRGKSSSGSQSPVYEQWASTEVSGRSKGTGTSDHPELLLPPGWEEAMAEMAKE